MRPPPPPIITLISPVPSPSNALKFLPDTWPASSPHTSQRPPVPRRANRRRHLALPLGADVARRHPLGAQRPRPASRPHGASRPASSAVSPDTSPASAPTHRAHRRRPLLPLPTHPCRIGADSRGSIREAAAGGAWWLPRPPSSDILVHPSGAADPSGMQRMVASPSSIRRHPRHPSGEVPHSPNSGASLGFPASAAYTAPGGGGPWLQRVRRAPAVETHPRFARTTRPVMARPVHRRWWLARGAMVARPTRSSPFDGVARPSGAETGPRRMRGRRRPPWQRGLPSSDGPGGDGPSCPSAETRLALLGRSPRRRCIAYW